ncbi:hypothetical protein [Nostoc sphaeroides]|nr:hypothetical protein [Nostoc sphaeroides]
MPSQIVRSPFFHRAISKPVRYRSPAKAKTRWQREHRRHRSTSN